MFLILPIIAYVLFFLNFRQYGMEWRRAVLASAVFEGLGVVAITEGLSAFQHVTRNGVAFSWLSACFIAAVSLKVLGKSARRSTREEATSSTPLDCTTKLLLAGVTIIVLLVLVVSLVSAPNVWDAMEYHLPRTTMWISNHSVRFYATPDFNQLILGPWAEFAMMHTELLWGSDRFVNIVEFLSFLGSLVGVSLIAKMFGAGSRGQAFAVIVCATIPEGILEASGPMNTYVGSFWILTTIVFLMSWNEEPSWLNTVCIGVSTGIAILTKGTTYILLPLVMAACWWMGSKTQRIRFLKLVPLLLAIILAVNGPQYARNYGATGSPLAVPLPDFPRLQLTISHLGVTRTLANAVRNLSLHFGTPSQKANNAIERVLRVTIRGIGSDPDDPNATWLGGGFLMTHFSFHEVHAGNPLHLALIFLAIGFAFWKGRHESGGKLFLYSCGLIASFLFFSALVRWAEWSSRYQLPLFVLGAGLVGFVIDRYFKNRVAQVLLVILLVCALPFALLNRTRSLIRWSRVADVYHPREFLYFTDQHEAVAATNIAAVAAVHKLNCKDVALDSYSDSAVGNTPVSFYVYPMLALLHVDGEKRKVWYAGVDNRSKHYGDWERHQAPCAVICLDCARVPAKWVEYKNMGGEPQVFDYIVVFSNPNQTSELKLPALPGN